MKINRRKSRVVKIGNIRIGGDYPVAIQSMTKVATANASLCIKQIKELENAGCEIVRVAVKDMGDARAIKKIKAQVKIPIVADIHFDYRLALTAIDNGADKIRLNPGNIEKESQVSEVISALRHARIPLRIGVNSGSVKELKLGMSDRLVKGALGYIRMIEKLKFYDLVISLKGSTVLDTIDAYRKMARLCDYPLHLGVTATGSPYRGVIKSAIAIGALLLDGIGDTIRISLTEEPKQEVVAAKAILESLALRHFGPQVVSCPTCGRCSVNLVEIVRNLESVLAQSTLKPKTVAVMGCVVNGPGEAKEADIGIAFGKKEGLLFKKGKPFKKIKPQESVKSLINYLKE
jgi:(E)-4-hydroxy-3-methylbut-2-enyl-diphosphate synthase